MTVPSAAPSDPETTLDTRYTDSEENDSDDSDDSDGAAFKAKELAEDLGGGVAAVAVVMLALWLFAVVKRRRRRKSEEGIAAVELQSHESTKGPIQGGELDGEGTRGELEGEAGRGELEGDSRLVAELDGG